MRASLATALVLPLALAGCPALLSDWTVSESSAADASPDSWNPHAEGGSSTGGSGGLASGGGSAIGGSSGATGGAANGGAPNTGDMNAGGVAMGGSSAIDAGAGGGNPSCDADAASCSGGDKCCPAVAQGGEPPRKSCVASTPLVGCDSSDCGGCPQPPNSVAVCNAQGACDFQCSSGFVRMGTGCQPSTTGSGGSGGSIGTCDPVKCPASACNIAGPFPCCTPTKTCGCTWSVGAVCYKN